jgi:hypothetical protein
MPKYYVQTGQMRYVIDKTSHHDAIMATLKYFKGKGLLTNLKICVSEIGWTKKLKCYDTDDFLKGIL